MFEQFCCLWRSAHAHPAGAETKVEHFQDLAVFFENDILSGDSDIGGAVFHIGGYVRALRQEELELVLFIHEDEFSGVGVLHLLGHDPHFFEEGHRVFGQSSFCQCYGKISHDCPSFLPGRITFE